MKPLNFCLSFLKKLQKKSLSFCPFCVTPQILTPKRAFCTSCSKTLSDSFFKIPIRLISFQGLSSENTYEFFLLKAFSQGKLRENNLDLVLFSEHQPSLYILSSLTRNTLKPLCYIRFITDPNLTLLSSTSVFFYTLTDQNSSLSQFENLAYKTLKNFPSLNPFRRRPLFLLNLSPLEEILLNVPSFLSNIFEKNSLSTFSVFSTYIRSTTALWFGRRFLMLLEDIFPKVFYTSFNVSKETLPPSSLIEAPFLWILQEWGYLPRQKKPSFLKGLFFKTGASLKKPPAPLPIKSKSPPIFSKNA